MKFTVTMKSPDALHHATMDMTDAKRAECEKVASQWLEYSEYLSIEIDTVKRTCKVLPVAG